LLFAAAAAIVSAFVVAACAIELRGDDDSGEVSSSLTQLSDPAAAVLARCRTITVEQVTDIQECRRVWEDNRRRFLGQRKASAASSVDVQPSTSTPSSAQPKDPGRLPQGTLPVAAPKCE
jgi:conjugative transfer region protein TrbK